MKKKKSKNNFNISKIYQSNWDYIKNSKKFIYTITGIFFLFFIIGFFIPAPEHIAQHLFEIMIEILETTQDLSGPELTAYIFVNNLSASFTGLILGILLGIFPIFGAILNGYLLGFVSAISVEAAGIFILWRLLPHGIFELPAIFISLGLGFKLGWTLISKREREYFKDHLLQSLKVLFFIIVPLLVIAAIIEGILITMF